MSEAASDQGAPVTATIRLGADFEHPVSKVWNAFADTDQRVQWGVPEGEEILSTAIITWTLTAIPTGARVELVDQVVSFVGQGMIDRHRNGHEICLRQLGEFLSW